MGLARQDEGVHSAREAALPALAPFDVWPFLDSNQFSFFLGCDGVKSSRGCVQCATVCVSVTRKVVLQSEDSRPLFTLLLYGGCQL